MLNNTKPEVPGIKFDQDKLDWTLLPWDGLEPVVEVLRYGELKYTQTLEDGTVQSGRENWRLVKDAKNRYLKAAFRHLVKPLMGEYYDPETKKPHFAHAVCCLLFILALDHQGTNKN